MAVSVENLPEEHRAVLKRAVEAYELGKDRHEAERRKMDRYYKLYRSYKELKRTHADARPQSVDAVMRDAMHGFGADLFIPYVFSVIETTLARMLAQNPRMLVTPAPVQQLADAERLERATENMRLLVERGQDRTRYHLTLQDVGKSGLIMGAGVGKTSWLQLYKDARHIRRPTAREEGGPAYVIGGLHEKGDQAGQPMKKLAYEGPVSEWVDMYDFIHDPRGAHLVRQLAGCCRWVIHRTWLDNAEMKDRIERKVWELPPGVDFEDLCSTGNDEGRDEIWKERMAAAGFPKEQGGNDRLHEVWEYHNGDVVTTVVDKRVPVQHGPNPHWHGELPFQLFRPTRVAGEFFGMGEAEAIEDLQEEMNIMRAQRRDNAAMVLQRPFAYFEGLVHVEDFEWGPGVGLGVDGDPNQLLSFPTMQDIPNSGYQEEAMLQRDIERVTGIDDTVSGGEGGGGATATATGVQMIQAAAGVRIANKTKLLELEYVGPQAEQHVALYQQKITTSVYIPGPPKPEEPHRAWSWYEMNPEELAGDMEIAPKGGSMAPDNPVEKMEKATRLWQSFSQDPYVDPMWIREYVLENFGIDNPRAHLIDPGGQISPEELELAAEGLAADLGMDPAAVQEMLGTRVMEAKELAAQMEQEGGAPQEQGPPAGAPPA